MKGLISLTVITLLIVSGSSAFGRDSARDFRKMVGYTIVLADRVDKVIEKDRDKYIKLSGGLIFKVDLLVVDPLILTDVIVFEKPIPKSLLEKYQGKLPANLRYFYKLMVDNEVFDAELQ